MNCLLEGTSVPINIENVLSASTASSIYTFLIFLVLLVLALTVKMLTIKTFKPTDPKLLQLFSIQGILRYSFVPVMLIPVIGLLNGLILIIFPIIWFIVSIPLSGKKMSQPVA